MAAPRQRHWAQWVWLAAGAAVAVRVAFIFFGAEDSLGNRPDTVSRPRVTVVSNASSETGALVAEQATLFDQKPLSMPTKWNAGARELPDSLRRQPGQVFGLFDPRMVFPAERLDPLFAPRAGAPTDGIAGLKFIGPMTGGWAGVGRVDRPIASFPPRDASIEVVGLADRTGTAVLADSLQGLPPEVQSHDWAPLEYSVVVSSGGMVGVPTLVSGSGREAVDAYFGGFLARDFRLGERLLPGLYRVRISR